MGFPLRGLRGFVSGYGAPTFQGDVTVNGKVIADGSVSGPTFCFKGATTSGLGFTTRPELYSSSVAVQAWTSNAAFGNILNQAARFERQMLLQNYEAITLPHTQSDDELFNVLTGTGDYTLQSSPPRQCVFLFNNAGGARTIQGNGQNIIVAGASAATYSLADNTGIILVYNGTAWFGFLG